MSVRVESDAIGGSWLGIARLILADGRESTYDGLPIRELTQATLEIAHPDPDDPTVAQYADPERLAWMLANFTDYSRVAALGGARSYASRLYDYSESGADQIQWVINRLRDDPTSRSATITTFEPLLDTSYIPCVSMLDFWMPDETLELVVYAHSIDFGAKGYANLLQLADLQQRVARELGRPIGLLTFIVKSAHIYETEFDYMQGVLAAARQ